MLKFATIESVATMTQETFYYKPRSYQTIKRWKNVSSEEWQNPLWQDRNSIRDVEALSQVITLTDYQKSEIQRTIDTLRAEGKESMRITPYYATLMQEDVFHPKMLEGEKASHRLDPIFWQSVPTPAHLLFPDAGKEEAMEEGSRSYGAVYQRYPNRVAFFVSDNSACAAYCTHCQRTKSLDSASFISDQDIQKGLFYIAHNPNIDEVLVTGGDALRIGKKSLGYILGELSRVPHLRSIRIATRVPVVMPMGVTEELLNVIDHSVNKYNKGPEKLVYFMTHINHYQEITEEMHAAIKRIRSHGYSVRNQTVLLKHVNAYYKTLATTFRRMFWAGVEPYYLLQCHKEKGLMHFITPIQIGKIFIKHLQGWISGIYKPMFASNIEGGGGKVLLMPSGHDTVHSGLTIEDNIYDGSAKVMTWDGRIIFDYEALGRASRKEYANAVKIMDQFIGRKDCFLPCLNIVNKKGEYIETTNRGWSLIPLLTNEGKAKLLEYEVQNDQMPITNPSLNEDKLDALFARSKYVKKKNK
ncbi:MAG: KamA family radical SAM protein [Bacteroidales bacterium]|nr:KamA family radical SAM protein [Bacteroidales bacterium]